ncbi:hypothetical protein DKX38_015703 [Salix brachista]|uniref:Transmembrane protein n=1 Tax=Salix brachista TaxID=2182728 RepID=A0A5N5L6B2_9ROSI|nr:hypothetical protein DKX38_015703 [Salix brachista]
MDIHKGSFNMTWRRQIVVGSSIAAATASSIIIICLAIRKGSFSAAMTFRLKNWLHVDSVETFMMDYHSLSLLKSTLPLHHHCLASRPRRGRVALTESIVHVCLSVFFILFHLKLPFPAEEELDTTQIASPFILVNSVKSTSHSPTPDHVRTCSLIQLPGNKNQPNNDIFTMLNAKSTLEVIAFPACMHCHREGGECQIKEKNFSVPLREKPCRVSFSFRALQNKKLGLRLGLGMIFLFYVYGYHFRKRRDSSNLLSMNSSSDPSSKADLEGHGVYLSIPIFSYTELGQATNTLMKVLELYTVIDGREVAVKRLYEHSYKRVKQFMNEIEILTRLHHKKKEKKTN